MALGPVQLLVVGFTGGEFKGEIRAELERLRQNDVIRLVDMLAVRKDEQGNVQRLQQSDLAPGEAEELGAMVGALIGLGTGDEEVAEELAAAGAEAMEGGHVFDESDVWYVEDAIPPGTAA